MLRIATINTWKGEGEYSRRMTLLIDNLKKENLDVLCCQEAFRTDDGTYDTARVLAKELGMTCSFSAARQKNRIFQGKRVASASGLAILTGHETWMMYSGSFPLPGNSRDNGRVAQFAVVRKNGDVILFLNLHLSHLKNGVRLRKKQLQAIWEHPIMEKQFGTIVFCGDFNATEKDEELIFFFKKIPFTVRNGFLSGGGYSGQSTLVANHDTLEQRGHIDHIFIVENKQQPLTTVKPNNGRLILDQPDDDGIFPSDHFGVAVDLQLSRVRNEQQGHMYRYLSCTPDWCRNLEGDLRYSY